MLEQDRGISERMFTLGESEYAERLYTSYVILFLKLCSKYNYTHNVGSVAAIMCTDVL